MTVGSFAVRAVGPDGLQLANVAAIAAGPAAALSLVKRQMQGWPEGTRFHVRGGAPRRPADYPGYEVDFVSFDELGSITEEQVRMLRDWGRVERFDEDPDDALEEYRGDVGFAWVAALLGLGLAAMQALRWWLS